MNTTRQTHLIFPLLLTVPLMLSSLANAALKKVASCAAVAGAPSVMIVKQWHYGPSEITRPTHGPLPQDADQLEIFNELKSKIEAGSIKTIVAEGCRGPIDDHFTTVFNGWDYSSLREADSKGHLSEAQTMIPLKLEVLFKDRVDTVCGDDPELIKNQLLRLSDVRGSAGFLTRLEEFRDDAAKRDSYLKTAIEVFKLPNGTSYENVLTALRLRMKKSLSESIALISERNAHFVNVIKAAQASSPAPHGGIAVVIGGIHAPDLVERLSKAKIGCDVYQSSAYVTDEEDFLKKLESYK